MSEAFDLNNYKLNWVPDPKDSRDLLYHCEREMLKAPPPRVDMRESGFLSAIQDQRSLGSCTGQATNGAVEFKARQQGDGDFEGSALYAYWNARWFTRTTKRDSGAYIRYAIEGARRWGICREELHPYVQKDFAKKPSAEAYASGNKRDVLTALRIADRDLQGVKDSIANGNPVVFGFTCVTSLNDRSTSRTGIIPLPKKGERVVGGHAILAVGYDDAKEHVIIRNSWGTDWGDDGYGYMDFGWFRDARYSDDFWSIQAQESGK